MYFHMEFDKFKNAGAQALNTIYLCTLKLLCNSFLA